MFEINCFGDKLLSVYTPVVVDNGHPLFYLFVARVYIYIGTLNSPCILRTVLLQYPERPEVLMYLRYLQQHEINKYIYYVIYVVHRRGTAGMILVPIHIQPCGTDEIIETLYQMRYLLATYMFQTRRKSVALYTRSDLDTL